MALNAPSGRHDASTIQYDVQFHPSVLLHVIVYHPCLPFPTVHLLSHSTPSSSVWSRYIVCSTFHRQIRIFLLHHILPLLILALPLLLLLSILPVLLHSFAPLALSLFHLLLHLIFLLLLPTGIQFLISR